MMRLFVGQDRPLLRIAERTRSRDSWIAVSGRPTTETSGRSDREMSTSTSTSSPSSPTRAQVKTLASTRASSPRTPLEVNQAPTATAGVAKRTDPQNKRLTSNRRSHSLPSSRRTDVLTMAEIATILVQLLLVATVLGVGGAMVLEQMRLYPHIGTRVVATLAPGRMQRQAPGDGLPTASPRRKPAFGNAASTGSR